MKTKLIPSKVSNPKVEELNELRESIRELFSDIGASEILDHLHSTLAGYMESEAAEYMNARELSRITFAQTVLMCAIQKIGSIYAKYEKGGAV